MPKFISDADMAKMDGRAKTKRVISDDEMTRMEGAAKKTSAPEAFLRKVGDSALLGYSPQINAAIEGLIDPNAGLDAKMREQGFKIETPNDDYVSRRDRNVREMEQISKDQPVASFAGSLAGGSVYAPMAAARGAGLLTKLATAGGAAALQGVAMNPGDTEGVVDPIQADERGSNALRSGLIGAGGQALSSAVGSASKALRGSAERSAVKALGPYARDARNLYSRDKIQEVGSELLDSGVVGGRPVSYEKLAERADAALKPAGEKIGAIVKELDAAGSKIPTASAAANVRKTLGGSGVEGTERTQKLFDSLVDRFSKRPDLGIEEAQNLKNEFKKLINWDRLPGADIPDKEKYYRAVYTELKNQIEKASESGAAKAGVSVADSLKKAKKTYGAMKTASKIANLRESKEFANRFISPSDYAMGGIGALGGVMSGDDLGEKLKYGLLGLSAGAANKAARQYGNQLYAPLAAKSSKVMGLLSDPKYQGLLSRNPGLLKELLQRNEDDDER